MQSVEVREVKDYPWIQGSQLLIDGRVREGQLLVDVRTPMEFREAHVPTSRNVPLADLPQYVTQLKKEAATKPIILICRTQNRIKLAYEELFNAGVTNCRLLEGGVTAWRSSGFPVIQGKKSISLEGRVRLLIGAVVLLGTGLGAVVNGWFLLLPALAGVGLMHAGMTDSCLMAVLLARLPFNRASSSFSTDPGATSQTSERRVA